MKKQYLYLAASPSFSGPLKDTIKVGISNDPWKRIFALRAVDHLFDLHAVYKFKNIEYPIILECDVVANHYKQPLMHGKFDLEKGEYVTYRFGREYFSGEPDKFCSYIESTCAENKEEYERVL